MPMGMSNIQPVADNTTLVNKKFPVNEESNNEDSSFIEKYNEYLTKYEDIYDYQTGQINNIKEHSDINNLQNLFILYNVYDGIKQILFDFKQELQNDKPDFNKLLQYRTQLLTSFNKLLLQMELYLQYINNNTKVNINKKDTDQYDMLVPSDKKDWLVNQYF